jgi:hypothetical protein
MAMKSIPAENNGRQEEEESTRRDPEKPSDKAIYCFETRWVLVKNRIYKPYYESLEAKEAGKSGRENLDES